MAFQPYLIGDLASALEKRLQPWLLPDDAQSELLDGYVYRGVMSKRAGYNYFATGVPKSAIYRESRIIHTLTGVAMVGVIDGVNRTFTLAGTAQIARGSVTITGNNPPQVLVDDGVGGFTGPGVGTINYLTGAISVTFTLAPAVASTVLITYSFMPGNPVMMIANFITASNVKQLVVADTRYVNRYNSVTNILEDISPAAAYTGTKFDFFSWVNYPDANSAPRLIFTNNVDVIQQYDGTNIVPWAYTSATITALLASWVVQFKGRLVMLRTTETTGAGTTVYPLRIRITGFGASCDVLDTSAIGAGFIDIPEGTGNWIQGASFNRDDLIIFTESSTWVLKYTGNDSTPFVLNKIDDSRGSQAAFSAFTYLNRTSAASPRGLINTDGYRVERQDIEIPDFSFNEIDGANFGLCFAGAVDEDKDHYLLYPEPDQPTSTRILTTNYEEDNYAIYRLPLSCMGTYVTAFDYTWNDLANYQNWAEFAADFGNWNNFAYTQGAPFSVGGGHRGEIWRLNVTEVEDNPVRVRNITIINANTLEITTDWNNYQAGREGLPADTIYLTGVGGMLEVNNQQYPILSVTNNNVFRVNVPSTSAFTAYTSGGVAARVIPFSATTKQFNPFVGTDKKVLCGWLYMYVSTAGTQLTRNVPIADADQTNPCLITTTVDHNLKTGDQVKIFGVVGMVQLNNQQAFVTVLSETTFTLDDIDATAYTAYTSGGYVACPEPCKLSVDVFVNDNNERIQLNNLSQDPYQGNCSNLALEDGSKKWYKIYINQTGKFIQFRFRNTQAGSTLNVHAYMPGMRGVGRII